MHQLRTCRRSGRCPVDGVDPFDLECPVSNFQVWLWGMRRFFEVTKIPGTGPSSGAEQGIKVEGKIAQLEVGATHVAIRTACGRVFTYGSGTALGLPKSERKQWELAEPGELPRSDGTTGTRNHHGFLSHPTSSLGYFAQHLRTL
eukprot:scaffold228760_cov37-Tisochrysis_lutea.AAC.3